MSKCRYSANGCCACRAAKTAEAPVVENVAPAAASNPRSNEFDWMIYLSIFYARSITDVKATVQQRDQELTATQEALAALESELVAATEKHVTMASQLSDAHALLETKEAAVVNLQRELDAAKWLLRNYDKYTTRVPAAPVSPIPPTQTGGRQLSALEFTLVANVNAAQQAQAQMMDQAQAQAQVAAAQQTGQPGDANAGATTPHPPGAPPATGQPPQGDVTCSIHPPASWSDTNFLTSEQFRSKLVNPRIFGLTEAQADIALDKGIFRLGGSSVGNWTAALPIDGESKIFRGMRGRGTRQNTIIDGVRLMLGLPLLEKLGEEINILPRRQQYTTRPLPEHDVEGAAAPDADLAAATNSMQLSDLATGAKHPCTLESLRRFMEEE